MVEESGSNSPGVPAQSQNNITAGSSMGGAVHHDPESPFMWGLGSVPTAEKVESVSERFEYPNPPLHAPFNLL